jgi:putative sigma-54 modulation protein
MYASIDEVSDLVKSKLVKYKERIIDSHRQGKLQPALEDAEIADYQASNAAVTKELNLPEGVPPVDMSVIRKKSFPMDPITVEEAVLCLEYIEHDFYVFKSSATGKISVVYKRNHGGVGLIEPE